MLSRRQAGRQVDEDERRVAGRAGGYIDRTDQGGREREGWSLRGGRGGAGVEEEGGREGGRRREGSGGEARREESGGRTPARWRGDGGLGLGNLVGLE
jgi:hypothetical protein